VFCRPRVPLGGIPWYAFRALASLGRAYLERDKDQSLRSSNIVAVLPERRSITLHQPRRQAQVPRPQSVCEAAEA
jgi:hypothetical protein